METISFSAFHGFDGIRRDSEIAPTEEAFYRNIAQRANEMHLHP